jgi:diguanylate cyclase (GGDEF)-like protein/PAS domain S-box-containing protein
MMAKLYDSASGVIVQYRQGSFNVVSASDNSENFLQVNSSWPVDIPSFCRRIMETDEQLYVKDAVNSDEWSCIPPVADGPVRSYSGYPLYWPDGTFFGSFCVIDTKSSDYAEPLKSMLGQLKLVVESELKHVHDLMAVKALLGEKIGVQQLLDTEQEQSSLIKNALSLQESINTATLASLVDSVIRISCQGKILAVNEATQKMFGYEIDELIGKDVSCLIEVRDFNRQVQHLKTELGSQSIQYIDPNSQIHVKRKDRSKFAAHLSVSRILVGSQIQFIALITDISAKVEQDKLLKKLALYDQLTDCANRNLMTDRVSYQIADSARNDKKFTLIYIDLDKFKPINDNYGNQCGDAVLSVIGRLLKAIVRPTDLVARVGGDEFVIVFNKMIDEVELKTKIVQSIEEPIPYEDKIVCLSASTGSANFPCDGNSMDSLLEVADSRMYREKNGHHRQSIGTS